MVLLTGGSICHSRPVQLCTLPGTKIVAHLFLLFLGKVSPSLKTKWRGDFGGKGAPSLENLCALGRLPQKHRVCCGIARGLRGCTTKS